MPALEHLLAQLRPHIADPRVLDALRDVPREHYVDASLRESAWENTALPIACGQTISQPLVVARMCDLLVLSASDTVLDVGTGSGYHAAVLARLCRHVYSIEVLRPLAEAAQRALAEDGVDNVTVVVGDGTLGLPRWAPYDAINVAAAAEHEIPAALLAQLAADGRLVVPIGGDDQRLVRVRRTRAGFERETLEGVRFVPLIPRAAS